MVLRRGRELRAEIQCAKGCQERAMPNQDSAFLESSPVTISRASSSQQVTTLTLLYKPQKESANYNTIAIQFS